jgi:hypothetical protein
MHMESTFSSGLNNPNLFEVNTALFLGRLQEEYNREMTLGTIPQEVWKSLARRGFDLLWCMGVWERSKGSKTSALSESALRKDYDTALPGWSEDDVIGSPYAVYSYRPDPRFGTEEDLKKLKECLNEEGIRLILDFVPNHLACDHPWTQSKPEYFIQARREDMSSNPDMFFATKKGAILAHGRDPYFPSWKDTVQLNYFSIEARSALIEELLRIAQFADGARCDMAMLVLSSVFEKTWGSFVKDTPRLAQEFWVEAIDKIKELYPSFIFIAEAYWDLEWQLQQMGFDYTYDKKLYDLLANTSALEIHDHLWAESSYQSRSVRFIENHDEPRAATAFGKEKSTAAAIIAATLPGLHLFHDGQMEGSAIKQPVQLQRKWRENPDRRLYRFYDRMLDYTKGDLTRRGTWKLIDPAPAWESNQTYRNLLSWIWYEEKRFKLIVVNYAPEHSRGRIYLPRDLIHNTPMVFHDALTDTLYEREPSNLISYGLYIDLNPWQAHLFDLA